MQEFSLHLFASIFIPPRSVLLYYLVFFSLAELSFPAIHSSHHPYRCPHRRVSPLQEMRGGCLLRAVRGICTHPPSASFARHESPLDLNPIPPETISHLSRHGFAILDNFLPEPTRASLLSDTQALLRSSHAKPNSTHILSGSTHAPTLFPKRGVIQAELSTLPHVRHADFPTLAALHRDASIAATASVFWPRLTLLEQAVKAQTTSAGASFPVHVDSAGTSDSRVVTALLYPHADWPCGQNSASGALRLYPNPLATVDITPRPGRLVLLASRLVHHRVMPAKAERVAVTVWLSGSLRAEKTLAPSDKLPVSAIAAHALLRPRFRDATFRVALRDEWITSLHEAHPPDSAKQLIDGFQIDLALVSKAVPRALAADGWIAEQDIALVADILSDPQRLKDAFLELKDTSGEDVPFMWA